MLKKQIRGFIDYCKVSGFKTKSLQTLTLKLNEFNRFLKTQRFARIHSVNYSHLCSFVADYKQPSVHVKKARV